ncbi:MAG: hypothetical protein KDL10_04155 [Kiritimatiellae bacterium]|nr:hypothetical protein [Kiritimatiellia bacterium]
MINFGQEEKTQDPIAHRPCDRAHKKQVQTYLRLTGVKLGYLLNFGENVMMTGITRCVNGLEE